MKVAGKTTCIYPASGQQGVQPDGPAGGHTPEALTYCITIGSRSLPEVLSWIACRILTPAKGDSQDHRDTSCGLSMNRPLCVRRDRSHRASHWLCPTHVAADRQTVSGPRHLWGLE